jgi:hypothetical protein
MGARFLSFTLARRAKTGKQTKQMGGIRILDSSPSATDATRRPTSKSAQPRDSAAFLFRMRFMNISALLHLIC